MTTAIRRTSDNDGVRSPELEDTINAIEEQLSELAIREEDTEWVVDLQSRRVVKRAVDRRR